MNDEDPSILMHVRDWLALPFVVTVVIPYLLCRVSPSLFKEQAIVTCLAGPIVYFCGLWLQLYTSVLFKKFGKGTLAPWQPTQVLVIRGPYRYCRNPMITGVLFMLAGEALFLNSLGILIWTGIFFLMNTLFFIFKEEPDMLERFGVRYALYKKNVPRWIPRITPYKDI